MRITTSDIFDNDYPLEVTVEDYDTGETLAIIYLDLAEDGLIIKVSPECNAVKVVDCAKQEIKDA